MAESINQKVFITGATGFVGAYLTRLLLQKGYAVRAIKRPDSQLDMLGDAASQIEWIDGDLLDIPSLEMGMEGIDKVYHCAAVVSYDPRELEQMMAVNVEGTANVVNVALHKNIKKMLYISSIAAIGHGLPGEVISEKNKWERSKHNTNYSISKFLAEQEVWRGFAEGLPVVIVNPSVILGSGRWQQSSIALFYQVWKGLAFYPPGGTGFVDVRDVARMSYQLMESDLNGQRFIASAENLKFRSLFTQIAEALGKKPPHRPVTSFLAALAWRIEWLRGKLTKARPLITRETAASASRTATYDHLKSVNLLGFTYTPISQTIRETAQQMKEVNGERTAVLDFR